LFELDTLYITKNEIVGFNDGFYWSSTDFYDIDAWGQFFFNGFQPSSISSAAEVVGVSGDRLFIHPDDKSGQVSPFYKYRGAVEFLQ